MKKHSVQNTIYCYQKCGLKFGGGHGICIYSNANATNESDLNLCSAYKHQQNSEKFQQSNDCENQ
jgi:hypothetical protein